MPQLDVGTYAPQLIWLAIVFTGLYLVMAWRVLPRIATVLGERRDKIDGDLADAEQFKRDAEKSLADYEEKLAEAKSQAQAIVKASQDKARAEIEARQAELGQDLAKRAAEASEQIGKAKAEAMSHIREVASDAAGAIVERLIGETAKPDQVQAAVDAAASNR
ncbi:MAG TPA: F0F1 ATP synthase subunit B' [Alphaproteobacteria bacterium]|nr:F0F1 ATP synthase subunit B' [Alphaproteobacteria bacterium]